MVSFLSTYLDAFALKQYHRHLGRALNDVIIGYSSYFYGGYA